ncbi:hypothetical protein [Streptomyces sp. NBC_01750]|uniref:hypothetical protein n=1 Tax=Streptomyces sp. NBC_01750 TaxID=2975928 RepID=UPI002DDB969D|nr:hypothetical protein [Streptomyces sp. NBC_01750]WSD33910.1 hypothetical protein OG966_19640 [Streptomyces sp. NBC_01750]
MRRRHGAALAAVALCLGGALTACGSGGGTGYAAVGAAGSGSDEAPTAAVPPKGKVVLVPLDGATPSGDVETPGRPGKPGESGTAPGGQGLPDVPDSGGTGSTSGGTGGADGGTSGTGGNAGGSSTGDPASSGGTSGGGPATPTTPGTTPPKPTPTPPGPAVLSLGAPVRAALGARWCEKVTVEFRNTGGSPVTSGTVTFATHIIGALGIDWATIESAQPLPAPIAAGAVRKQEYTVCVDAWRVPLGMHIETQDVTAVWK